MIEQKYGVFDANSEKWLAQKFGETIKGQIVTMRTVENEWSNYIGIPIQDIPSNITTVYNFDEAYKFAVAHTVIGESIKTRICSVVPVNKEPDRNNILIYQPDFTGAVCYG